MAIFTRKQTCLGNPAKGLYKLMKITQPSNKCCEMNASHEIQKNEANLFFDNYD